MSTFEFYWHSAGLPLSRAKGVLVDAVPFSLVEASLWLGGAFTLAWIFLRFRRRSAGRWPMRIAFILGPFFLLALGLGQGAFPVSLAPTAWRLSLAEIFGTDSLDEADFETWVLRREDALRRGFDWEAYQSLSEREALRACDGSLDTVLADLGLPAGRTVRAFKPMGPLTTSLGLIYGGPAFHDPFFGEIGLIRQRDYPAPLHWRLIAACHEAAHAKGFTREMDAEVLTQLALLRLPDARFGVLADIHFLQKTARKIQWPEDLREESLRMREERETVRKGQPVVSFLRHRAERWGLVNSGKKYGDRQRGEPWNPRHPFFASLSRLQIQVRRNP